MDFFFENFSFFYIFGNSKFPDFQVSRFPCFQKSGLGQAWAGLGRAWPGFGRAELGPGSAWAGLGLCPWVPLAENLKIPEKHF